MTLQPTSLDADLREIRRRLQTMEGAERAALTSISDDQGRMLVNLTRDGLIFYDPATGAEILRLDGSGLSMYDAQGDLRTRIGEIATGYGMQVLDAGGTFERLRVDEAGFRHPYFAHPWSKADDFVTVTSGTFATVFRSRVDLITSEGLYAWVTAGSDVGTTGEFRLRDGWSGATTAAVAVPDGSTGTEQQFRWLHGEALSAGPITFELQARRTSGAGDVRVYAPYGLNLVDPSLCVADGVP